MLILCIRKFMERLVFKLVIAQSLTSHNCKIPPLKIIQGNWGWGLSVRLHWTDFYSLIQNWNPRVAFSDLIGNLWLNENYSFSIRTCLNLFGEAQRSWETTVFVSMLSVAVLNHRGCHSYHLKKNSLFLQDENDYFFVIIEAFYLKKNPLKAYEFISIT